MQVATLSEITADVAHGVEVDGKKIILVRVGDAVHAYAGTCPHAGAPLDQGALCNGRIICPWHKAMFALEDGALLEPPALAPLARYPVHLDGEAVHVGAEPIRRAPPPPKLADKTFLIVGAGAAGVAGAAALREFGFAGRLILLGAEPDAPYDRTALSKFVLEGAMKPDEIAPLLDAAFYAEQRIERRHGTAIGLDPAARRVTLADGDVIDYDAALLAPGGTPRRLDVPGADLPVVHTLRTLDDARRILPHAQKGARAVVIGGSFIGLECASALSKHGLSVTVVSPDELPFAKIFGRDVARAIRRLHEGSGVSFITGHAAGINATSCTTTVTLDTGQTLAAELVVVGIGVRPATDFLSALPLAEDGGVTVDAGMRAADNLYAAGDVARFSYDGKPTRIEHWRVAQQHARIAARGMLGEAAHYEGVPFFWTYHFGNRIELLGHPEHVDETAIDGDLAGMTFLARQTSAGRLVGAVACQREAEMARIAEDLHAGPSPVAV